MIKPTPQYDDRQADNGRDFAGTGSFSLYALERMLQDCMDQPQWRPRADLCAAYYDGKQLTPDQRAMIAQEGLEERATNLIRPVINSVLGQEAKSRTDVKIEADDDDYADVAEVISMRMKEAERETRAHMAVSNGYASGVKTGLGWGHVCRNSDPLAYPYKVEDVPRDEIWWDWRGQRGATLLDGCRWLVRKRFVDLDELEAAMPEHRQILRASVSGWESWLADGNRLVGEPDNSPILNAWREENSFQVVARHDWCDSARKMLKLYEVWYRVPAEVVILHMSPTRKVAYDENDPRHIEAVARGLVKVSKGITSQVRMALYAGPHRLIDKATTKRNFPYFPFFAFRDDADKSPYGLIEGMISPQDEYNERRLRVQWMLKARQIQMDSDALDTKYNTIEDIADAVMRPDLVVVTNPQRMNRGQGVIVKNELSMQKEQFEIMADSKELIQHTAGRFNSQMGSAQVQSGVANSILVEQGEQSMGEMNDNYVFYRRSIFECLADHIIEDHTAENMQVRVGNGKSRRVVVLNAWQAPTDQAGQPIPDASPMPVNMVKDAPIKTALAEIPSTPAYRQQAQQQLATIIQALGNNPQAIAVLAPSYVEASSLNNRQQVADDLRKATGVPIPGDKEGQAKAEAMQEQVMQQKLAQEQALAAATTDDKVASAERSRAMARQATANAVLIEQRTQAGTVPAEVDKTIAETERLRADAANEDELISSALDEAEGLQVA